MTDERAAEGVEHLQAAARELLAAARSFLDVVEDVVEDRARFAEAATVVGEVVRDGLGLAGRRTRSWPEPEPTEHRADPDPDFGDFDAADEPSDLVAEDAPPEAEPEPSTGGSDPPGSSRVRRIPVD